MPCAISSFLYRQQNNELRALIVCYAKVSVTTLHCLNDFLAPIHTRAGKQERIFANDHFPY